MNQALPLAIQVTSLSEHPKADDYQTPPWVLEPLYPFMRPHWKVWEPAAGNGNLSSELFAKGYRILPSDILPENEWRIHHDFRKHLVLPHVVQPPDCIITNPPFSLKDEFLERCYWLGLPFALLMTLNSLEGKRRQKLYKENGLELILLPRRVNFTTADGRIKEGHSSSWFATAWFTWGFGIGRQLTFWQE